MNQPIHQPPQPPPQQPRGPSMPPPQGGIPSYTPYYQQQVRAGHQKDRYGGMPSAQPMVWARMPSWIEIAGAASVGAGFVVSLESSSASWVDGELASFSYTDVGALVCGLVAICLGGAGLLALGKTHPSRKVLRVALAVLIIGLGGVHVARGVGAFASPPEGGGASMPGAGASVELASNGEKSGIVMRGAESRLDALAKKCSRGEACEAFAVAATKACPTEPSSCNDLGFFVHYLGRAGGVDLDAARAAFKRACESGDKLGCGNAEVLFDARGIPPKATRSLSPVLEEACGRENPVACYLLGAIVDEGRGSVEADPAKALASFSRACRLSHPRACNASGFARFESGDHDRARADYTRGCELEDMHSCWNLAQMTARGQGGPADEKAVRVLARKACKLGSQPACAALRR